MRWFAPSFAVFLLSFPLAPCHPAPRQDPSPTPVFAPKYMEQITLRYADPIAVAKSLNGRSLPPGVIRVQPDSELPRTLRVLGTQDGIATMRTIVSLIDVRPRKGTFRLIMERVRFGANGKKTTTVVGKKTLILTHNIPGKFAITDDTGSTLAVSLTARLPQTKETPSTLLAQFGWRQAKGSTVGLERAFPLPVDKSSRRVIGLTFADDSEIIGTVGVGNTPAKWTGTFTAYYLALQTVSLAN